MADSNYFMKILKEFEKPRSTEFVQHKEQRYERLTRQLYMAMTSLHFNKYKVTEKLTVNIMHMLDTDEYPDEYCRDYKKQRTYLSYHLFIICYRQNLCSVMPAGHRLLHVEQLESFLYFVRAQNFENATQIATSEVSKMLSEPVGSAEILQIGKYKYVENSNIYIMMYYFKHITMLHDFNPVVVDNMYEYLKRSIQGDLCQLPKNFLLFLRNELPMCQNCVGTRIEFGLHTYYMHCMIKLNNDKNLKSKHAQNFANFDTLPANWTHSTYCPNVQPQKREMSPSIILPNKLCRSMTTFVPTDLCRGSFSNVMDSIIINLSNRGILSAMCLNYKDWIIDRSNVVWKGISKSNRNSFGISSIGILIHLDNNIIVKFNKGTRKDEEEKVVEVSQSKGTKQGKKKKMINQIVQTKSTLKDCKIKQTQTCMEESVVKDHKKLKQRIMALESEKSKTQREINSLKDKLDKMNVKSTALNYELQKSQIALKAREEEITNHKLNVDLLTGRNLASDHKIAEKTNEYDILYKKYNTLQMCSVDINARNQDLQERCERQKTYVLENMALKQEIQKVKEAYYRVTSEYHMIREQMNGRQKFVWEICNMLKMHLKNGMRSMAEALQRYERRSLMIVMEYEAETATEEDFKFMQHMGELKDKFKEFEIYCKNLEDLLNANQLHEVVGMLRMHEIVRIFENCPNILFDDISKMITLLSNKDSRIRKDQASGACYMQAIGGVGVGGGDQAQLHCESNSMNGKVINEYTDENGKYHLLFMRVKENVYNAENDDIIVQALQEIRRKNNNRMSFLTYEQIVNKVQHCIDENVEDNSCCICFHGYDKIPVRVLSCSHKFHKHCIEHWFKTNNVCPICRSVIAP